MPTPAVTGRPRVWCSNRCRRAAHEARRARREGAFVVKVVERVVTRTVPKKVRVDHQLSECLARVSGSPTACRNVVNALIPLVKDRTLFDDPKWSATLRSVGALEDAMVEATRPRRRWYSHGDTCPPQG